MGDVEIRPFESIEEYRACVDLQEATWGIGFSERVAPAILKVSQILGGVAAGAWTADGTLVGFVFGMTGVRSGELVHWSDMLAVAPSHRGSGLGTALKAYQRDEVLERGVTKMHWTFDPLRAANAHLNINRLGIIVREYAVDMYGQTDSPLHAGIGTDRLIALWELNSERVALRLGGAEPEALDSEVPMALGVSGDGQVTPGVPELSLDAQRLGIQVPSDIGPIMADDLPDAVSWRMASREAFVHYLERGYEVRGFRRGESLSTYVLEKRAGEERV